MYADASYTNQTSRLATLSHEAPFRMFPRARLLSTGCNLSSLSTISPYVRVSSLKYSTQLYILIVAAVKQTIILRTLSNYLVRFYQMSLYNARGVTSPANKCFTPY